MKVKLLMQWDIRPGHEGDYFEFIVREFAPAVTQMGLQVVDAWYTLYGNTPQILIASVAPDKQTLKGVIASQEWGMLLKRLSTYVHNLQKKVIPDHGSFQL